CKGSIYSGFWLVWLIVLISSVIICILKWKKNLKIGGCCKKEKTNIAIFIGVPFIVAVVTGLIFGILEIIMECFGEIALVVSIVIGLLVAVVQWIFIMFWNCKK
ncbi:uncharacterized protein LOC134275140, partial [Saccostrea cucullata]|uniref:uncharacterized protein LOC134275140 n=1 Tax=Saccostrea cuccullata TaxID=36930 RepID=UPI002ED5D411